MDIKEFQELSKRTMPNPESVKEHDQALANYAMGLAGESGEVVDILKKVVFHGHRLDKKTYEKLYEELGDILHYVVGLCTLLSVSAEEVMEVNIEKLKKRYPEGFSTERSVNRND